MPSNLLKTTALMLFFSAFVMAQDGKVSVNVDKNVSRLMAIKKEIHKAQSSIKIQIYSGSRRNAEAKLMQFNLDFPEISTVMVYETPNYKIWSGDFRTQLEADRALIKIRKTYKEAFSFRPKQPQP
ncbi:MAG: translation initiation factor IF-2 [Flavobacteriaceae bacterium]|nr:translation initiation factor IF-2 [Flavobacteriaceae bacterium]|tara:strand:- start:6251 stop:6628 length:378 start_codon:yes stop_codon:yes gene_type:complete